MKILMLCSIIGMLFLQACGSCSQMMKDFHSDVSGGLNREVILYDANGKIIKQWNGNIFLVDESGANTRFIYQGKAIVINGTYIIEEK